LRRLQHLECNLCPPLGVDMLRLQTQQIQGKEIRYTIHGHRE
jgi:hypothetical protein